MYNKSIKLNAILSIIKQACSIIFPLITFHYISTILGSDTFGKYNFSNSIVSYFSLIASLGIVNYAVREGAMLRSNPEALNQFSNQVFSINIVTTIIAYIILFIMLAVTPKLHSYKVLILIQSIVIIFTTIGADWINTIHEDYLYISVRYIIFQIISLILLFLFVKDEGDYLKYAAIVMLSSVGANILNTFYIRKYVKVKFTFNMKIRNHILPMILLFCNSLAVTIYVNSDITLLGIMQDDKTVGVYSVAVKVYTVVKQLLNAFIMVTIPRLSLYTANKLWNEYNSLLDKVFKVCLTLILPAIVGLFMLSKSVVLIIAGPDYTNADASLKILSIALGFSVLSCFFTNSILLPNRKEKYFLKATLLAGIANLLLNFIAIPLLSLNGAALTTVFSELIVLGIAMYYSRGDYNFKNLKGVIIPSLIGCVFIIITCWTIQYLLEDSINIIFISMSIAIIGYGIIQVLFKNEIVTDILYSVKRVIKK